MKFSMTLLLSGEESFSPEEKIFNLLNISSVKIQNKRKNIL